MSHFSWYYRTRHHAAEWQVHRPTRQVSRADLGPRRPPELDAVDEELLLGDCGILRVRLQLHLRVDCARPVDLEHILPPRPKAIGFPGPVCFSMPPASCITTPSSIANRSVLAQCLGSGTGWHLLGSVGERLRAATCACRLGTDTLHCHRVRHCCRWFRTSASHPSPARAWWLSFRNSCCGDCGGHVLRS